MTDRPEENAPGEEGGDLDRAAAAPETGDAATPDGGAGAPVETDAAAPSAAEFGRASARGSRRAVLGVPIEVVISVGRARPLLSDLVALGRDSVLSLDSRIEDPVEIMVGGRVIARGELQEIDGDGRLGVRLTEVADSMSAG